MLFTLRKILGREIERNISKETISKTNKFCCCNGTSCVFLFYATRWGAFNLSSLWTHETNGPPRNKSHNRGIVFNRKMKLNERQNAVVFVIFIERKLKKQIPLLTVAPGKDVINFRAEISTISL